MRLSQISEMISLIALLLNASTPARADSPQWSDPLEEETPHSPISLPNALRLPLGRVNQLNPRLGSVTFKGELSKSAYRAEDTPRDVETIYADTLFELLPPTLRDLGTWAERIQADPTKPEIRRAYAESVSEQLNQLFVLRSVADMLDFDAALKKIKVEVPAARVDFAVRKVLLFDNQSLNDMIFEDFVSNQVTKAQTSGGEAALSRLRDIGIPKEIVDLILNRNQPANEPPEKTQKRVQETVAHFKAGFDADLLTLVESVGLPEAISDIVVDARDDDSEEQEESSAKLDERLQNSLKLFNQASHAPSKGLKVPPYGELSVAMLVRLADLAHPTREIGKLFSRMKAKVGVQPFFFGVAWSEGKDDPALEPLASGFRGESWQPLVLAGQNPRLGALDTFPATLEKFYTYVEAKLFPRVKAAVRQKVANGWLFGSWRNREILNPNPPRNLTHVSQMFNPFSAMMLTIPTSEYQAAYDELKYEIAAVPTMDFNIVQVKLGDSVADVSTAAPSHPCALAFNKAFEGPYTALQQDMLKRIADPNLTTRGYDELIAKARAEIPVKAFDSAKAALALDESCRDYPVSMAQMQIHADPAGAEQADEAGARARFVGMVVQSEQLQRMMIPKRSRRDSHGNVYHYFFQSRDVKYLPWREDAKVDETTLEALRPQIGAELCDKFRQKEREWSKKNASFASDGAGGRLSPQISCDTIKAQMYIDNNFLPAVDLRVSKVYADLKDAVVVRRVAERMAESVKGAIGAKYRLEVSAEPFTYNGVNGFQLKRAAADPSKWIPQMFVGPRMQMNPELLTQRRLIEKSNKIFERAYDLP